jgi:hypothetical protein
MLAREEVGERGLTTMMMSIIVMRLHSSLWSFMPLKRCMQLGDIAMVGVGDGGWLWFCQLTGDLGGC